MIPTVTRFKFLQFTDQMIMFKRLILTALDLSLAPEIAYLHHGDHGMTVAKIV